MEALELSPYVSIDLPCYAEVKCFLDFTMEKYDGLYIPDGNTAVGKEILRVFHGKRARVRKDRVRAIYTEQITLGIRQDQLLNYGTVIPLAAVRDMNLMLQTMMKETLHRHLQLNLMADPHYNIKEGIRNWIDVLKIPEEVRDYDAYKRTFNNWRLRHCPQLIREVGKPPARRAK